MICKESNGIYTEISLVEPLTFKTLGSISFKNHPNKEENLKLCEAAIEKLKRGECEHSPIDTCLSLDDPNIDDLI